MGKNARARKERPAPHPGEPREIAAPPSRRTALALGAALILIAVLTVYVQVRSFPFINYDDPQYVVGNPQVQKGLTAESAAWAFRSTEEANWHPLTWLSHMADVEMHGLRPGGHHMSAVVIHAAAAILLFAAFLLMTGSALRALAVALLFAVHPLHAESVAWVAERKDVLSGLFWCAGLLAYAAYARRPSPARFAGVFLCFAAGLMSKPMVITFPFALLLLDFWPLGRLRRETAGKLLLEKLPLLLLIPISAAVTVIAQKSGGAVRTLEEAPLLARLGNAAVSYAAYLLKTIWPANLAPFYPWKAPAALAVVGSILLLAAITALAIRARKSHPWLLAGWLWYLGTLVPVIGIVQVGEQSLADRYTYLPLIGIFAAIVWGGAEAARAAGAPFSLRAIATGVWILILMVVAGRYAATWRSSIDVWSRSIEVAQRPTSDMHLSLGLAYAESGRIPEALAQQRKAVELDLESLTARLALATTLKASGDFAAAAAELEAAKRIDPKVADVHNNLGNAYDRLGDVERAEAGYREALRLDPRLAEAHMNLATLLSRRDDARGAAEHYGRALAIQPASIEARVYFALALWNAGDRARSVEELQRAGTMDPAAANGFVTKALRMPPDPGNLDHLLGNLRGQL